MLLPDVDPGTQDLQLLVAIDDSSRHVIAAAALGCDTRPPDLERWHVDLHVIPPYRRRGVARTLLGRIVDISRLHGIPSLDSWGWAELGSDPATAWTHLGFSVLREKFEFIGTVQAVIDATRPLHEQSLSRNRIPPTAKIIPLRDADPLEVAQLHARHLGGTVSRLLPLMNASSPDAFSTSLSTVLLLDGRVVGCVLVHDYPAEKLSSCDAVIVDTPVRRGWANVWLRYQAALWSHAAGLETVRFHALGQHRDTQHVSRRLGSSLTKTHQSFRLQLLPDPQLPAAAPAPPASNDSPAE